MTLDSAAIPPASRWLAPLVAFARLLANPARGLRRFLRPIGWLPFDAKVALDLYDRPHYAYGIHAAAVQAEALGLEAITCIELGVGAGEGLLAMERIAKEVEAYTHVRTEVVGFDTGRGLPQPRDYRDLPHLYRGGFYPMDQAELRSRLTHADLVIGPVSETVPDWSPPQHAPIGFIAFDLDYYSSTMDAFQLLDAPAADLLPRVVCYFDDIANSAAMQCIYTGEEQAISDFNEQHDSVKIGQIRGLASSRAIPAQWNEQMYAAHFFSHPLYDRQVVRGAADYITPLTAPRR